MLQDEAAADEDALPCKHDKDAVPIPMDTDMGMGDATEPVALKRKATHDNEDAADQPEGGDSKKAKQDDAKPNKPAYSKAEAASFTEDIKAHGGREESRLKCAADDILMAINFVFDTEFDEADRKTSMSAMEKTKSLCLSVWAEFLLTGEVSLNGKRIRAYSALRPELQHICRLAKQKLNVSGSEKDPLDIARELTMELIEAPVHMLAEGDDDSSSRVALFMTACGQDAAKLQRFVEDVLDLPLSMHEVHIQALKGCVGKTLELVDFLSGVQNKVESAIPTRWLSFATDVSDHYAQHAGFPGGTEQAAV